MINNSKKWSVAKGKKKKPIKKDTNDTERHRVTVTRKEDRFYESSDIINQNIDNNVNYDFGPRDSSLCHKEIRGKNNKVIVKRKTENEISSSDNKTDYNLWEPELKYV